MIAAELRGGSKPSLNEALGWIGSRVDDIYGTNVGRLEDVWIDPGTGVPRWLLVKEGRFGGRTTLIPFEDATAGAGHVWVPYEREIVRDAPEIEPGAPLTQQVEAALRSHYTANVPAAISHHTPGQPAAEPAEPPVLQRRAFRDQPLQQPPSHLQGVPPAQLPARPAPPIAGAEGLPAFAHPPQQVPEPQPGAAPSPPGQEPEPREDSPGATVAQGGQARQGEAPAAQQPTPTPAAAPQPPAPAPQPPQASGPDEEALTILAESGVGQRMEIEFSGELQIRGDLRTVRIIPPTTSS